ncbi:MAG TPA: anti-sigma factor [Bryobacteraceae bacterium]|jgi:anti-sigma-K factor RskA
MTCEELRPDYLAYALGSLEDPERSEVRAHLERGCQDCQAGVRDAREWVFAVGASVEGPAPPRSLRSRVLTAVAPAQQKRWNWWPAWIGVAATALVAVGVVAYQERGFRTDQAAMQAEIQRNVTESTALRQAFELIQAPETREVTFGQGQPAPPRGRVFVNPSGVLLVASRLPAPPAGKTYEMWLIRGGKPAPAGLFASDAQGDAVHLYRPASPAAAGDVVAVTLEVAGGVNAPTSMPVIAAAL